jgi:carbonic anhydrase/acetyltransferase-like protein (isoleucine patch superfamily)
MIPKVQNHGLSVVMGNTFVGTKVLVFKSVVGQNCVIEPAAVLMGVEVADGRYVLTGSVIKT